MQRGSLITVAVLALGCSRVATEIDESGAADEASQTSSASGSDELGTDSGSDESPQPDPDQPADTDCYPPFGELCPDGQKCSPIIGECCGLFECVPVLGEGEHGDPCTIDQDTNLDDCGPTSYCLAGVCREFCDGDANCPGEAHCLVYGSGRVWVCIDQCDPLVQDCPDGQGCYWGNEFWGFQCAEIMGEPGLGEPCGRGWNQCAPGLTCAQEGAFPGGCGGLYTDVEGCCTNLCDTNLGEAACAAGPVGSSCVDLETWFAPGLGACVGPTFAAGDLQVVEVAADPPGFPPLENPYEYIELVNLSDKQLELGWFSVRHSTELFKSTGYGEILSGDGGCDGGSPWCLAPGRRLLLVIPTYMGETGDALVVATNDSYVLGLPFTTILPVFVTDAYGQVISTYRQWDDPEGEPLPVDEQPMHRVDPSGPDTPENWVSGPGSPGLP